MKMRAFYLFLAAVGLLGGCAQDYASHRPVLEGVRSENLATDIRRMWETEPMRNNPESRASTEAAQAAASRVFSTVSLQGKTRTEVIALLGDPQRSSQSMYNFPFYPAPNAELVYRFDTGTHGWQFNVFFDRKDRVTKVERWGIE